MNAAGGGVCGWRFRVRSTGLGGVGLRKLSAGLKIGLDQVVLQQYFQGLGETFRSVAVYLTDVFRGVRQIQDVQRCDCHGSLRRN